MQILDIALELRKEIKQMSSMAVWHSGTTTITHITIADEKFNLKNFLQYRIDSQTLCETLAVLTIDVFSTLSERKKCGEKCTQILQQGNAAFEFVKDDLEWDYHESIEAIDLDAAKNEGITLLQFLLPFAAYGLTYGEIQPQIDKFCDGDKDLAGRFELLDKDSKILGGCIYE